MERLIQLYPDMKEEEDNGPENPPSNRRGRWKKGDVKPDVFFQGYRQLHTRIEILEDAVSMDMAETSELRAFLNRHLKGDLVKAVKVLPKEKQIKKRLSKLKSAYVNILAC